MPSIGIRRATEWSFERASAYA